MNELYALQKRDLPRARELLKDAFQHDPLWNRLFAGRSRREERLSAFFEVPLRVCLRYGRAVATSPELEGVAAWLPGPLSAMRPWALLRSGALMAGLRIGMSVLRDMERAFTPMERDRFEYMRDKDLTYLQVIGVGSAHQGRGHGGRLLRAIIAEADAQRRHLYLETETEPNVVLYEHFGFRVLRRITLPVLDLPLWEMTRAPGG